MKDRFAKQSGPIGLLFLIYFSGVFTIIRANYKYVDDLGRVAGGYKGWDDFSRYTSYFLSAFIHADNYLTDISPLPQIIAILFLSFSGIIVLGSMSLSAKVSIWQIISIVPLGLSPYFLECLSYKYDAPYMALSVLAAVSPIIFADESEIKFGIASLIGTLLMLTTYQASSGIFPILVVLVMTVKWNHGQNAIMLIRKTLAGAGGYILGIGIYKLFILKEVDEYVSSSMTTPDIVVKQLINYYKMVAADFKTWWLLLSACILIAYVVVFVFWSPQKKIIAAIVSILSVIFGFLFAFGMYPILSRASYYPRAMYGFGAFLGLFAAAGVSIVSEEKNNVENCVKSSTKVQSIFEKMCKFGICALCTILSYTFLVFAFSYGNCLNEQARYTDVRVQSVINDIKDLDMMLDDEDVLIQLSGSIGKSPIIRNIPQSDYSILDRLVPETFAEDWKWSTFYFYNYFDLKNVIQDRNTDLHESNLPIIKDTIYHTIYGADHKLLIELKE